MAQDLTDGKKLAQEKRDGARRARRLAQTQTRESVRERLVQFAVELEAQAEALEQATGAIALPPVAATPTPTQPAMHQQPAQQQQGAPDSASTAPDDHRCGR